MDPRRDLWGIAHGHCVFNERALYRTNEKFELIANSQEHFFPFSNKFFVLDESIKNIFLKKKKIVEKNVENEDCSMERTCTNLKISTIWSELSTPLDSISMIPASSLSVIRYHQTFTIYESLKLAHMSPKLLFHLQLLFIQVFKSETVRHFHFLFLKRISLFETCF